MLLHLKRLVNPFLFFNKNDGIEMAGVANDPAQGIDSRRITMEGFRSLGIMVSCVAST